MKKGFFPILILIILSGIFFMGCDLSQPHDLNISDEGTTTARNFSTTLRTNNNLPEGIGLFRINHWTSYSNPTNNQIRLRIVVNNAAGAEIANCLQSFTYDEGKDNQWINWGLHLFEWDFASVGPFVTVRFYKDGTGSTRTITETKTRTFTFELGVGAETGAIAKLFAKVVANFKFNATFTHTWTDSYTLADDDVHLGTYIVNYDHYLDHVYDCGDLEFKMARYYFALNGNQSYTQDINRSSAIKLRARSSSSQSVFVSVQKSDISWNRYGTEAAGWLSGTDIINAANGAFDVRQFALKKGLAMEAWNYYRIKFATGLPSWYEKTILLYLC